MLDEYEHWKHSGADHANAGKPFDSYLASEEEGIHDLLDALQWSDLQQEVRGEMAIGTYKESDAGWPQDKIDQYNHHLHGKILIPQPAQPKLNSGRERPILSSNLRDSFLRAPLWLR